MLSKKLFKTFFVFLIFSFKLFPYFSEFLNDTRGDALVGSFRIYNFDSRSIFFNPASLVNADQKTIFINYSPGYLSLKDVDLSFNSFSFNTKFKKEIFGIGYKMLNVSSQYKEEKFIFAFSKEIFDFSFGINLNLLRVGFILDERASSDPVFSSKKGKTSFSFDFGMIKKLNPIDFSLFISNINSPDMGIRTKEKVPPEIIFTAGKKFYFFNNELLLEAGLYKRMDDFKEKIGAEYNIKFFEIRLGFDNKKAGFGFGFTGYKNILFDYAVLYPFDFSKLLHEISIGVRF